jgi:hypothetical protein
MIMGWLFATMGSPAQAAAPLAPAISNVSATRVSNGTDCGVGLGVRYTVVWTPNGSVTNADHDVKITLSGVGPTVTATRAQAATIATIDITSQENHVNGAANPGTYTCTFELIATAGPTTIQSGNVTGDPNSAIYDIETDCAV